MDIRRIDSIKSSTGEIMGNRVRVRVIKNKVAAPFRKAEFDIMYNEGISRAGSILDVATDLGIIEKRGSWFSYGTEQIGQGREQSKAAIAEDEQMQEKILNQVNAEIKKAAEPAEKAKPPGKAEKIEKVETAETEEAKEE
jgi:recombination protein RecA